MKVVCEGGRRKVEERGGGGRQGGREERSVREVRRERERERKPALLPYLAPDAHAMMSSTPIPLLVYSFR